MIETPKTITYDIETMFNIGTFFGRPYDVNIGKIIQKGYVLGFAWKYLDKKKIHTCYIWDFPLYKKDPKNDIEVIKKWRELMLDSQIVVGHNSDKFDNRVMYGRMMIHKLPPLALPLSVDTYKAAKKLAAYDSYKLDDISESFGYGNKIKTSIELWFDCMMGDQKAQKQMVKYNKRDVEVTEKVYLHLKPHITNHPNMATLQGTPDVCRSCGLNVGFNGISVRIVEVITKVLNQKKGLRHNMYKRGL